MPDYTFTVRVRNEKIERVTIYCNDCIGPLKMTGKYAKRVAKLLFKKSTRKKVKS